MFFLGLDYIISSITLLTVIAFVVFKFRKYLFKKFYKETTLDLFISKLRIYLEKNYPDIKYDLSIINSTKSEPDPDMRKSIIVSHIIDQYKMIKLNRSKYPESTPSELHQWSSYVFNCEPNKDKLPSDWGQRKNALLLRDNKKCLRCSKHLTINTVSVHMIKPLKDGGKYYLENLLPVCKDCDIILTNNTKKMTQLDIVHDLNDIIEQS